MGTIGSRVARGIVYTRCVRIFVRKAIKICEVSSEGFFGEVGAERRLGRVCEVGWNGVNENDSNRSLTMGQRKTTGSCSIRRDD